MGSYTLDELKIRIAPHDLVSGVTEHATLFAEVNRMDEYGSGIVSLSSHLPFDDHVEFVKSLLASFAPDESSKA